MVPSMIRIIGLAREWIFLSIIDRDGHGYGKPVGLLGKGLAGAGTGDYI